MSRARIQIEIMREHVQTGWPLILHRHDGLELLDGWRAMREALASVACCARCKAIAQEAIAKAEERK